MMGVRGQSATSDSTVSILGGKARQQWLRRMYAFLLLLWVRLPYQNATSMLPQYKSNRRV